MLWPTRNSPYEGCRVNRRGARARAARAWSSSDALAAVFERGAVRDLRPLTAGGIAVFGDREPKVSAQRVGFVLTAKQPTLAQDGQHLFGEQVEVVRSAEAEVEAVERALLEPVLDGR